MPSAETTKVARGRGGLAGAVARCEEAPAIFEEGGDERGMAYTLGKLGIVTSGRHDDRRSLVLDQESLSLYEKLGDNAGRASASVNLGDALHRQGDGERASSPYG